MFPAVKDSSADCQFKEKITPKTWTSFQSLPSGRELEFEMTYHILHDFRMSSLRGFMN